jgi:hypothetical protein
MRNGIIKFTGGPLDCDTGVSIIDSLDILFSVVAATNKFIRDKAI